MKFKAVKHFFDFVELRTKVATVLPFLVALAYVFYTIGTINLYSTVIYIISACLLDMSVTAINNHFNSRNENQVPHYTTFISLSIISIMMFTSAGLGLYLVYLHGINILLAGVFCFVMGIAYSFGPAPICKTPYGEVASGFTVGVVIMFIVITINNPAFNPLGLAFNLESMELMLNINIVALLSFGILALPSFLCVANIMLANNICDEDGDRTFRFTLVHSLGKENALKLFANMYYASYISIIIGILLGIIPIITLFVLATFFPVQKNISLFLKKQTKRETFVLSVKNFVMIMLSYGFFMGLSGFF